MDKFKTLDRLIEQAMLQEDINFDPIALQLRGKELEKNRPIPNVGASKKLGDQEAIFNKLAAAASPDNKVELADIQYFLNTKNPQRFDIFDTDIEHAMHVIKYLPSRLENILKLGTRKGGLDTRQKIIDELTSLKKRGYETDAGRFGAIDPIISFLSSFNDPSDLVASAGLASQVLDAYEQAIAQKDTEKGSITSPSIDTTAIERGDLPEEYKAALKAVTGNGTMSEKITKLNNMSEKYLDAFIAISDGKPDQATALIGDNPQEILQELMILDLFNLVLKGVDAGSGAYYFEALLALLAGGSVVGKDLTRSGQAGAADFKTEAGGYGSAKFYKKDAAIKQSMAGFVDLYQKDDTTVEVDYAIGLKKAGLEQIGDRARGSSDPSKIIGIQIYEPKVTYDGIYFTVTPMGGSAEKVGKYSAINRDGSLADIPQKKKVDISGKLGKPTGTIIVAPFSTKTFRQYISDIISVRTGDDNVRLAVEAFRDYFDMLQKAEVSSKKYVSSASAADSQDTTDALNTADEKFTILVGIIKPQDDNQTTPAQTVQENKQNKFTALDKLIEAVILEEQKKGNTNDNN